MNLSAKIVPIEEIKFQEEMFLLMQEHYANTDKDRFLRDLGRKTGVICLFDEHNELKGFSSYELYFEPAVDAYIIFSGDTIIHRDSWGSNALFHGFGEVMHRSMISAGEKKVYWFLISKGFRTYCMLPLFFKEFYPKTGVEENRNLQELLHLVAKAKFGKDYRRETGIIQVEEDHLEGDLAEIPQEKLSNKHIRFFLEKNPGYRQGHELACITEISIENTLPRARRFVLHGGEELS
jgi:hypothetical protein